VDKKLRKNHHIAFVPFVATGERKVRVGIDIRETPFWSSKL
jgi:hypothetical protein